MRKQFKLGYIICFCLAVLFTLDTSLPAFVPKDDDMARSEALYHRGVLDQHIISFNEMALGEIRKNPGLFFRYQRMIESSKFLKSVKRSFLDKYNKDDVKKKSMQIENEVFYRAMQIQEKHLELRK